MPFSNSIPYKYKAVNFNKKPSCR